MRFNRLQSHMPRSAAAKKERNQIAFTAAQQMMDLSGWGMSLKNSEQTDPTEELGEEELVNQSATCLPLHACDGVKRMSRGLPLSLPQDFSTRRQSKGVQNRLPFSSPSLLVPSGPHKRIF